MQVVHAEYIKDYTLRIYFSNGHTRFRDMSTPFSKLGGDFEKWKTMANFKRFKIDQGNLVWGKDWDVIYPVSDLYTGKNL